VTHLVDGEKFIYPTQKLRRFEYVVYATGLSVMLSLLFVWLDRLDLLSASVLGLREWRILMLSVFIAGTATICLIIALMFAKLRLARYYIARIGGQLNKGQCVRLTFNTQLNTNQVYLSTGAILTCVCAALIWLDTDLTTHLMLLSTLGGCGWTLSEVGVLNESASALSS
jgi:hypothetical protein